MTNLPVRLLKTILGRSKRQPVRIWLSGSADGRSTVETNSQL